MNECATYEATEKVLVDKQFFDFTTTKNPDHQYTSEKSKKIFLRLAKEKQCRSTVFTVITLFSCILFVVVNRDISGFTCFV